MTTERPCARCGHAYARHDWREDWPHPCGWLTCDCAGYVGPHMLNEYEAVNVRAKPGEDIGFGRVMPQPPA